MVRGRSCRRSRKSRKRQEPTAIVNVSTVFADPFSLPVLGSLGLFFRLLGGRLFVSKDIQAGGRLLHLGGNRRRHTWLGSKSQALADAEGSDNHSKKGLHFHLGIVEISGIYLVIRLLCSSTLERIGWDSSVMRIRSMTKLRTKTHNTSHTKHARCDQLSWLNAAWLRKVYHMNPSSVATSSW